MAGYTDKGAAQTNKQALKWLRQDWSQDMPFYLFLHYLEPHNPIGAPKPFRHKFVDNQSGKTFDAEKVAHMAYNPLYFYTDYPELTDAERDRVVDLYDGEIAYIDTKIGEIMTWLQQNRLFDNTLVILTADHGEHFGEHDHYSHVASLYQPIVHIPFLVKYPKECAATGTCEDLVQHTDIVPTVIDMLKINYPGDMKLPGRSLLPQNNRIVSEKDRTVFAEWEGRVPDFVSARLQQSGGEGAGVLDRLTQKARMVRQGNMKYILYSNDREELFDLTQDPGEENNIAEKHPDSCAAMKKLIFANLDETGLEITVDEDYEVDERVEEHLKALGYL
jgi:arylsulfatase A-like enzyme